ncbi:hypothetical protein FZEAL_5163 [Fusarium zealandicum]|uniref:Uncharacterized protein n=1 Tax=Fusarium zealandicum TaxID=1053134 RepID=A0A8H4XL67_9HYPO|nr:hypothetical protein FZEAL_5163 [Fusarium zealandicum]
MNEDLSWINEAVPETDLPHTIWYPRIASAEKCIRLVRRVSTMKQAAAQALIVAGEPVVAFLELEGEPDNLLGEEAQKRVCRDDLREQWKGSGIHLFAIPFENFSLTKSTTWLAKDSRLAGFTASRVMALEVQELTVNIPDADILLAGDVRKGKVYVGLSAHEYRGDVSDVHVQTRPLLVPRLWDTVQYEWASLELGSWDNISPG